MIEKKSSLFSFVSDEKLQKVTGQIFIGYGILIGYELGLFKLLSQAPLTISEISKKIILPQRSVQALVSCAGALDFIVFKQNKYQLTLFGKAYLDPSSQTYYGKVFDLLIQESRIMSYEAIKSSILSGNPQSSNDVELFSNDKSISNTQAFIDSLHYKAIQPAFYWSKIIDLSCSKTFVDIGGGSGIHSIAACLRNSDLLAIVCDRPTILKYIKKNIQYFSVEDRIDTYSLDMWNDKFPKGDIHFYGDIFHDWPKDRCLQLAKKSYQSLPKGGKIIIHEMLFKKGKIKPFLTSAYNMKMMVWTEGQQFSKYEIEQLLIEAGFQNIEIIPALGNWSIIIGVK